MSGHSKWSTIKRKKGAADAKRGVLFTRLSKDIALAAREGGDDPDMNSALRLAIKKAKVSNMPAANIERAIKKGTGDLEGVSYEEITYEAYGPGGVAIMMDIITDNKNRSVAEIRHLLSKFGGNLGESGSVSWMFDKQGQVIIDSNNLNEEGVFEIALEAGANDFEVDDSIYVLTTDSNRLMEVRDNLENLGLNNNAANPLSLFISPRQ